MQQHICIWLQMYEEKKWDEWKKNSWTITISVSDGGGEAGFEMYDIVKKSPLMLKKITLYM